MAVTPQHPETDQLVAFGMGRLAPEVASTIESHLDDCPTCCETLLDLKEDTFIALVRSAPQSEEAKADVDAVSPSPADSRTDGPAVDDGSVDETLVLPAEQRATRKGLPLELAKHPRYQIVDLIGRGGMGDVYLAEHRLMSRPVALKVINRKLTSNHQAVQRFHREVQSAARLTHPNIVTAYDAEQAGDAHYLVMEYVDGTDLAALVKDQGPLAVSQACDFIRQAAAGLQHAHEQGMVHRDIKPHNLMVTPAGQVKILDFGLATLARDVESELRGAGCEERDAGGEIRNAGANSSASSTSEGSEPTSRYLQPASRMANRDLTRAGAMMGTPDFISPEQAGDARSVDIRSDIYSLGCTLYYLLTGKPPFDDGSASDRVAAHVDRQPVPIQNLRSEIPDALADVIRRMLAKDPAERFQSPADVADALAPFVDAHRTDREASPPTVSNGEGARHRHWRWVAALLAPLFIGMAGIIYVTTDRGTLTIESVDDSVEIVLSQVTDEVAGEESGDPAQLKIVDVVSGSTVRVLRSGTYVAQIQGDATDLELSKDRFVLKRGDEVLVRVTRKPSSQTLEGETIGNDSGGEQAEMRAGYEWKDFEWTPLGNPDPDAIRKEASADIRAGRYGVALSKLDWYFANALKIEPSQAAVRLSFALNDWKKLADKYPPALERLREVRDEARDRVVANQDPFESFQEFAAISAELGAVEPVVTLFKRLQQQAPGTAQRVYMIAQPALIAAKEYKLCGPYLKPRDDVPQIIDGFRLSRELQERRESKLQRSMRPAERRMENQSATLVALLVVNDREAEARQAAEQLKAAWDSKEFHEAIDSALTGKVPEPWPPRFQVVPDNADSAANEATRTAIEELLSMARQATTDADWRRLVTRNAPMLMNMPLEQSRDLIRLLAGLPDETRQTLLDEGFLRWKAEDLDASAQAVVSEIWQSLRELAPDADAARWSDEAREGLIQQSDTGFLVVDLPDSAPPSERPAGTGDRSTTRQQQQAVVWYLIHRHRGVPVIQKLPLLGSSDSALDMQSGVLGLKVWDQIRALLRLPYSTLPALVSSPVKGPPPPPMPGTGVGGATSLFGISDAGRRIVYVLVGSGSMSDSGAIRVAKDELMSSLQRLDATQEFQVIFYSNTPLLLEPRDGRSDMFRGTDTDRLEVRRQIDAIHPDGGTRHLQALNAALKLKPDVIFLLTDASQPELTAAELAQLKQRNVGGARIHCIEFGQGTSLHAPRGAKTFLQQLAEQNGGQYQYRVARHSHDATHSDARR